MLKGQRVLIHDTLLAELEPGREYPVYWRDNEYPTLRLSLSLMVQSMRHSGHCITWRGCMFISQFVEGVLMQEENWGV